MVISKEELRELEVEIFEGEIKIVDTLEKAIKACNILSEAECIGLDTETKPAFRKGEYNQVALLQLATDSTCFLFRINILGFPPCVINILKSKRVKKIGLSLKDDFAALRGVESFQPQNVVELQSIVGYYGINDLSLQKVYAILFKKRITKGQRLTNWEAEKLSEAQQMYAALDAWACLKIYRELMNREPIHQNGD